MLAKNYEKPRTRANTPFALVRDNKGKIRAINSKSPDFESTRNLGAYDNFFVGGWDTKRKMVIVNLGVADGNERGIKYFKKSEDFNVLPKKFQKLLEDGCILKTTSFTKEQQMEWNGAASDFQVLMSMTEKYKSVPLGRTGTLLYKGKPVIAESQGTQFLVEIKGVGCPSGQYTSERAVRTHSGGSTTTITGSFDPEEAKDEFENLELLRSFNAPTFSKGDSPRAVAVLVHDESYEESGYLIRLSPSNMRLSYGGNSAIPKTNPHTAAICLAKQFAEYMNMEIPLVHGSAHPENLVRTAAGYVLTDFADMHRLNEIPRDSTRDSVDFLTDVITQVTGICNITKRSIHQFYKTLASELNLGWNEAYVSEPKKLARQIWEGVLKPKQTF